MGTRNTTRIAIVHLVGALERAQESKQPPQTLTLGLPVAALVPTDRRVIPPEVIREAALAPAERPALRLEALADRPSGGGRVVAEELDDRSPRSRIGLGSVRFP